MNEPFLKVPSSFLLTPGPAGIKPTAKLLLLVLAAHHNRKTGRCNPKIETLAAELGVSRRTIEYALDELRDAELIQVTWRQRGSDYIITDSSELHEFLIRNLCASENPDTQKTTYRDAQTLRNRRAVSINELDEVNQKAAAATTDVTAKCQSDTSVNGTKAAAAANLFDLAELGTAIAELTGQHPGAVMIRRIGKLIARAGGDEASAVAFVATYRKRTFNGNGIWPTLFEQDYPAFANRVRRAFAKKPEPTTMPNGESIEDYTKRVEEQRKFVESLGLKPK